MPATVLEHPLTIEFTFANSKTWTSRLHGLPNANLALDLAYGLCELVFPHGTVGAPQTAQSYAWTIRTMVSDLFAGGFTGGASDLRSSQLLQYWLSAGHHHEYRSRVLLKGFDSRFGTLHPGVRDQLAGRRRKKAPKSPPYETYSEAEWQRLKKTLVEFCSKSWLEHRRVLAIVKAPTPRSRDSAMEARVAKWLWRNGPRGIEEYLEQQRVPTERGRAARSMFPKIRTGLFPTQTIQMAYRFLFGMHSGIVADGINDLGLTGITWTGPETAVVRYVKGRTGPEGLNLPPSAVSILNQWIKLSSPLRTFVPASAEDDLWIATPNDRVIPTTNFVATNFKTYNNRFVEQFGLVDDAGKPLALHRNRIRTTYQSLLSRRGWTGRTTIDPNHTATVEADHYLTPSDPGQMAALEAVIEDGQADLLKKAIPAVVLTDEVAAEVVSEIAKMRNPLSDETVSEILSGERDVFVAACSDQLSGMWGPPGKPCPARPWVCLLCPLAVFMPRHLPNLLRLKAYFARQFRQMTTEQFMRVFAPYSQRLDAEIIPRFSANDLALASNGLLQEPAFLPLRPEECAP